MHAAHAIGIRIPEELSIAGFDDNEPARFSIPPLTTIRQPLEAMARTAVEQLIKIIRPNRIDVAPHELHELLPWKLIERESIAKRNR